MAAMVALVVGASAGYGVPQPDYAQPQVCPTHYQTVKETIHHTQTSYVTTTLQVPAYITETIVPKPQYITKPCPHRSVGYGHSHDGGYGRGGYYGSGNIDVRERADGGASSEAWTWSP
ncbi:uncharacterized protein [Procambarus clarkii]|uniref:uncharacterized protein n=1 Tax=Procambarus clarkii TaxID=6728 RepID=UPI001E676253|nr:uncharacterized protein LOC123773606 [Procambarus clarkii]